MFEVENKSKIVSINNKVVKNQNTIECKLNISEEDYENILLVEGKTYLVKVSCLEKEVKYDGVGVFSILYKNGEEIKNLEVGVEYGFKFPCEDILIGTELIGQVLIKDCKVSMRNGVVFASGIVTFLGEYISNKETTFPSNYDGMIIKNSEGEFSKVISSQSGEYKIEDEFSLKYSIKNILCHTEQVKIEKVESGIGACVIEGEIGLSLVFLVLNEQKIVKELKSIPFRVEIENKEITSESVVKACVSIIDTSYKVFVDENKDVSTISVESKICANITAYEKQTFSYIDDLYSLDNEVCAKKEKVEVLRVLPLEIKNEKISGEISFTGQEENKFISSTCEKLVDYDYSILGDKLTISGVVMAKLLFSGADGGIQCSEVLCPFSHTIDIESNKQVDIKASICNFSVEVNKNTLNYQFILQLLVSSFEKSYYYVIIDVENLGQRKKCESAISVYIPNENDSLWDICKRLGVSEEYILQTNKELSFPLSKDERIVIYRELATD